MLSLFTDFKIVTAEQLCLERNRDEPTEKDFQDAVAMASAWNNQRIKLGLRPWQ